jgi:nicotinate-nucleotide adenylyltransferase
VRIGLFFGSFNPIHIGHLIIAQSVLNGSDLQKIWFVVSPHNPLKPKKSLANAYDRLRMVELATAENDAFMASNVEFKLGQPSFTIDTLTHLTNKYPGYDFSIIMGSDNLGSLPKWKNYEALLSNYPIYAYGRSSDASTPFDLHPTVHRINSCMLEISATEIRELIKNKKNVRYLLPDDVLEYINSNNLYL